MCPLGTKITERRKILSWMVEVGTRPAQPNKNRGTIGIIIIIITKVLSTKKKKKKKKKRESEILLSIRFIHFCSAGKDISSGNSGISNPSTTGQFCNWLQFLATQGIATSRIISLL